MKRLFAVAWLWSLALGTAWPAGLIIVHDSDFWRHPPPPFIPPLPPPRPPPRPIPPPRPTPIPPRVWAPLELSFVKADARINDQVATTTVEQEFYNPNAQQLEGTFLFPIPRGAQIDKFTMDVNGKPMEAELLAADKARGIYEDIVRKLRDPALLEYAGRDLFKVRIFPIEPHVKKRIRLAYTQVLKNDEGLIGYTLPFNTEKYSAKPARNLSLKVEVETRRPLKSIYSPTHKVEIKRHGENRATIGFESTEIKPDADFQLFFATEKSDVGLNLLAYKVGEDEGFFLLLASPGTSGKESKVIPKDVCFVLDTSGSMAGAKLDQAKKALAFCVENLNDSDRFEVLRFSTEVESLFDKLSDASKANRDRAHEFIKGLKPTGGTAIDDALTRALASKPGTAERPYVVIFLTDGRPTVGNTVEDQIVDHVKGGSRGHVRVFCFGIGTDVNTHLLDRITEETRAYSQYVLPEEDIEVKVSNFYTKIKEPVLASPKLSFPDKVRVSKLHPTPVPDLFKGEQLVLVGRYTGRGDGAIQLEGTVAGEARRFAFDVEFPHDAREHDFIPRLWATRRVGFLLDEIRLRGESKELRDEVTELARKYGIVTPYTAYLIHEDERQRGVPAVSMTQPRFHDEDVRREAGALYSNLKRDRAGASAVAGARAAQQLRLAEAADSGIAAGNVDAFYAAPSSVAAPAVGLSYNSLAAGRGLAGSATLNGAQVSSAQPRPATPAPLSRYVSGRTFYQNGNAWVESEVQGLSQARRVQVAFQSADYFELIRQHPEVLPWLALGSNVQFVLNGVVYEVAD